MLGTQVIVYARQQPLLDMLLRIEYTTARLQVWTDEKEVTAQTVIIATGAVAKRLPFKGSDEVGR